LIVEGYAVYTRIPASVKEEAPSVSIVVFPAIRKGLFVAGQLQHLRVRVFPPDTPAVMRSIKVRDG
jgi:hypothetical protein